MRLTTWFDETIDINGESYSVDLSFDNILRIKELEKDDEVDDQTKISFMFDMLVIGFEKELNLFEKRNAIDEIFHTYIIEENVQERFSDDPTPAKKQYDLDTDAELIYASFLMDYNLDLYEQQGRLHWKKFVALLNGLSDTTAFMKVVDIRTREVPKPNKHNQKEIRQLRRLKRHYALDHDERVGRQEMDKAAGFLRSKAKAGD